MGEIPGSGENRAGILLVSISSSIGISIGISISIMEEMHLNKT